jgi:hypothetical protein
MAPPDLNPYITEMPRLFSFHTLLRGFESVVYFGNAMKKYQLLQIRGK